MKQGGKNMSSTNIPVMGDGASSAQAQDDNLGRIAALLALVSAGLLVVYVVWALIEFSTFDWPLAISAVAAVLGGILYLSGKKLLLPWFVLTAIIVLLLPLNGWQVNSDRIPGIGLFNAIRYLIDFGFEFGVGPLIVLFFWVGYLLLFITFVLALVAFVKRVSNASQVTQVSSVSVQHVEQQVSFTSDGTALAGWFADPNGNPAERYWDGQSWTEQTRPQSQRLQAFNTLGQSGNVIIDSAGNPVSPNSRLVALLLCFFLGGLGIHRFYVGKAGTGVAMIFTLGGLGIWTLVDFIMIAVGSFRDKSNRLLVNW